MFYTRKDREGRGGWYLGILVAAALLLVFGWVVNVRMGLASMPVDVTAFLVILFMGFAVAHWVPVGKKNCGILLFGVVVVGILVVLFTFLPPSGLLFANLSLADALYTLPC